MLKNAKTDVGTSIIKLELRSDYDLKRENYKCCKNILYIKVAKHKPEKG